MAARQTEGALGVMVPAETMSDIKRNSQPDELKIKNHFAKEAACIEAHAIMSYTENVSSARKIARGKDRKALCCSNILGRYGQQAKPLA